jgi:hypothetical protein
MSCFQAHYLAARPNLRDSIPGESGSAPGVTAPRGITSVLSFPGKLVHLSDKPTFSSMWKVTHWKSVNTRAFSGTNHRK